MKRNLIRTKIGLKRINELMFTTWSTVKLATWNKNNEAFYCCAEHGAAIFFLWIHHTRLVVAGILLKSTELIVHFVDFIKSSCCSSRAFWLNEASSLRQTGETAAININKCSREHSIECDGFEFLSVLSLLLRYTWVQPRGGSRVFFFSHMHTIILYLSLSFPLYLPTTLFPAYVLLSFTLCFYFFITRLLVVQLFVHSLIYDSGVTRTTSMRKPLVELQQ